MSSIQIKLYILVWGSFIHYMSYLYLFLSMVIFYKKSCYFQALYALKKGLGGIMYWTIDTDDFRARCYKQKYPLIGTGRYVLFGDKLELV